MAFKEVHLMRCKGPGGTVEVACDVDDVTSEWKRTRIKADPGARLRLLDRTGGGKIEIAKPDHPRDREIAALPGKIFDPLLPPPWPPMELSSP